MPENNFADFVDHFRDAVKMINGLIPAETETVPWNAVEPEFFLGTTSGIFFVKVQIPVSAWRSSESPGLLVMQALIESLNREKYGDS